MYKRILLALDNSEYSEYALNAAIQLAKASSSTLTGIHVYAARLHGTRFKQMEPGLPADYGEERLEHLRKTHNSLIVSGLGLISDCYLDVMFERCRKAGVKVERRMREGRNYVELVDELADGGYDLIVMGAMGLGRVDHSIVGSVCERVARAARCDVLVARGSASSVRGNLLVGIDGSEYSFAALRTALQVAGLLKRKVEAVATFDPFFHTAAFHSIKEVLSKEAGKVFRFSEQEKLHDEIIDQGLATLYQEYLRMAGRIAGEQGMALETRLLSGKPFEAVAERARETNPFALVVGRWGFHHTGRVDLGSNAENLLRLAPCDVLVCGEGIGSAAGASRPEFEQVAPGPALKWTPEAEARLERVPSFARPMARKGIENYARQHGLSEITEQVFDEARQAFGM